MAREQKIRVGLVGASPDPDRSWGTRAHIPALRHLPDYELTAICTSSQATADAAAAHFGVANAFADGTAMAAHPDVDLVAVSVRTPAHVALIEATFAARKHVFCEWPLGGSTETASAMQAAAESAGVVTMVGLQSYGQETLRYVSDLIADGYVGRVLATNWQCHQENYGPAELEGYVYIADARNNANVLRIATGHTLSAMELCIGRFRELSANVAVQHPEVRIRETGQVLPKTSPDQIMVTGVLEGGALAAVHVMGGAERTSGTRTVIHGTEGDLLLTSSGAANVNRATFELRGSRNGAMELLPVPAKYRLQPPGLADGPPLAVAHLYAALARAIREGTPTGLEFGRAIGIHAVLDAVGQASATGQRQYLP